MYIAEIKTKNTEYEINKASFGEFNSLAELKQAVNAYVPDDGIIKFIISYVIQGKTKIPRTIARKAV